MQEEQKILEQLEAAIRKKKEEIESLHHLIGSINSQQQPAANPDEKDNDDSNENQTKQPSK